MESRSVYTSNIKKRKQGEKASRDQTVIPVVPNGEITSDVSVFEEYGDTIIIELEELSDEEIEKTRRDRMKKKMILLISMIQVMALSACGNEANVTPMKTDIVQTQQPENLEDNISAAQETEQDKEEGGMPENETTQNSRILIAYFSQPTDVDTSDLDAVSSASVVVRDNEMEGSTTEYVAGIIRDTVGGDLFRIETTEEYPSDYDELVAQARAEKEENVRPELIGHIENLEQYDTIILGYPSWIMDMPMPVYSFLEEYDFGAKTIIPFVTHGGSGFGGTRKAISQLQPGAFVSDKGLSVARDDLADSEEEIRQWAESLRLNGENRTLESSGDTVTGAQADAQNQQTLYLWEENNMPAITEYTENNGYYADDPDFRPYIVTFPVPEGTEVKGAVLICAGGAFQFRSDQNEGTPVAEALSELGYQSFVVNYRLRPYTQEEGALDLARAVRFVRQNADVYGIDDKDIAVMGFSAGGILAGEMLLNFDGTVNGTALDGDYIPDVLDSVSADAAADGMIYSFYGRLSVASKDVEKFAASDLPPTYFCYGTRDPFVREFEACIEALQEAGVPVEVDVLEGRPHGYGYTEGWIPAYAEWLENVFANN